MFNSKQLLLTAILILFFSSGIAFYLLQNKNVLPGGHIALSKMLWLGLVIFYWYVAPALLLSSGVKNSSESILIKAHLVNVWLRAIVELYMMYISHNWNPYYGITHDLLSLCLFGGLLYFYRQKLSKTISRLSHVLIAIFAVETCFAYYMVKSIPAETGPIYFVPQSSEYNHILIITWIVVIFLLLYLPIFVRAWSKVDA